MNRTEERSEKKGGEERSGLKGREERRGVGSSNEYILYDCSTPIHML